ncbi:MAG: fumarylacetoacetate hydrolase family protein, partial [Bacteroidota bacterium]
MKLLRFGEIGNEKPGLLSEDGQTRDCSGVFADWDRTFFNGGGLERLRAMDTNLFPLVADGTRLGPPIARPGKVICIGLNYSDHAAESGMEVPEEPIIFMKGSNTVCGPNDEVFIPRNSEKTDWEVELGVVIGKDARYLSSPAESGAYIAGYCVSHDVSERAFQLERAGQWTKGKSCDRFNPLGPWLVTADSVQDAGNLAMQLDVNGVVRQNGNTRTMVFQPDYLVYYLSQFMTLEAGDLLSTGTPPG